MTTLHDIHDHSIDVENRVIYLQSFNDAGEDCGVDHRVANVFLKNIHHLGRNTAKSDKKIVIEMNIVGGEWSAGMAIYDAIVACPWHVTINTHAQAESMSSIILQAANHRVINKHAYFMCHYGSAFHDGTVPDMIASANWNKVVTEQMCAIYRDRMIKSKWAIDKYGTPTERQVRMFLNKKLKDGDWYLFGDEIANYGFADEVFA